MVQELGRAYLGVSGSKSLVKSSRQLRLWSSQVANGAERSMPKLSLEGLSWQSCLVTQQLASPEGMSQRASAFLLHHLRHELSFFHSLSELANKFIPQWRGGNFIRTWLSDGSGVLEAITEASHQCLLFSDSIMASLTSVSYAAGLEKGVREGRKTHPVLFTVWPRNGTLAII